jgi:hypothetical protein
MFLRQFTWMLAYRIGLGAGATLTDFVRLLNPRPVKANGFEANFLGGAEFGQLPLTFFFPFAALRPSEPAPGLGSLLVQDLIAAAPLRELVDDQGSRYRPGRERTFGKQVLVVGRQGEVLQTLSLGALPDWLQSKMREAEEDAKSRRWKMWGGVELAMVVAAIREEILANGPATGPVREISKAEYEELPSLLDELLVRIPKYDGFFLAQLLDFGLWFETADEFRARIREVVRVITEQLSARPVAVGEEGTGEMVREQAQSTQGSSGAIASGRRRLAEHGDGVRPSGHQGLDEFRTGEKPCRIGSYQPDIGGSWIWIH